MSARRGGDGATHLAEWLVDALPPPAVDKVDERPQVDRHVLTGDLWNRRVQPRAVRQHTVYERSREIDPAPRRPQHPLDELGHLVGGQNWPASASDRPRHAATPAPVR